MDSLSLTVDGLLYAVDELPTRSSGKTVLSVSLAQAHPDTTPDSAPSSLPLIDRVDLFSFGSLRAQTAAPLPDYVIEKFGKPPAVPEGRAMIRT